MAKETKTHAGPKRVTITEDELRRLQNIAARMQSPMQHSTAIKLSDTLTEIIDSALTITPEERRAVERVPRKIYRAQYRRTTVDYAEAHAYATSQADAWQQFADAPLTLQWEEGTSTVELDDVAEVPLKP